MNPSLSDLYGDRPHETTLRNLAGLLDGALETSGRLRLFAVEAAEDGLQDCRLAYERMERLQQKQIVELERQLCRQLTIALEDAKGRDRVRPEEART